MKLSIILTALIGFSAFADVNTGNNSNVNICQPKIEVKACERSCSAPRKTKVVVKTVEKIVEKVVEKPVVVERVVHDQPLVIQAVYRKMEKNHISLLGGYGPRGNLDVSNPSPGTYDARTNSGGILGLQYMREVYQGNHYTVDVLGQAQTNSTGMVGVGLGF